MQRLEVVQTRLIGSGLNAAAHKAVFFRRRLGGAGTFIQGKRCGMIQIEYKD